MCGADCQGCIIRTAPSASQWFLPESPSVKQQAEVFSPENPARLEIHVLETD